MELNFTKYYFSDENIFMFSVIATSIATAIAVAIIARIYFGRLKSKTTVDLEEYQKLLEASEEEKASLTQEIENLKNAGRPALMKFNHELRTSINAILGISNLLSETDITKKQTEYIGIINDSSNKCLKLSNELLYVFDNKKNEVKSINIETELPLQPDKKEISKNFAKEMPLTILVAEDDAINKMIATKMLEKLGYEIDVVENGKEALEVVSHKNYDVIFMDIQMPVMDGREATKMMRLCLEVQPIIIAVTASIFEEEKRICMEAGMNDIITKPMRVDDIASMLEKWFDKTGIEKSPFEKELIFK